VVLQAWLERKSARSSSVGRATATPRVEKQAIVRLISKLRHLIDELSPREANSQWTTYDSDNTYSEDEANAKEDFVDRAVKSHNPKVLWDLGANAGKYSLIAARHSGYVVLIDSNPAVVDL